MPMQATGRPRTELQTLGPTSSSRHGTRPGERKRSQTMTNSSCSRKSIAVSSRSGRREKFLVYPIPGFGI
ncbi:hypothetical protein ACFPRL_27700 [Pseudoclavibacter helvolus]